MNETQIAQAIAVLISSLYLATGVTVLRACERLRDSMRGMVGYRLMFVITRLVWVLVVSLVISVLRQVLGIAVPEGSPLRVLVVISPIFVNAIILGGILWALMTVRSWRDLEIPDPQQDHLSDS